MHAIFNARPWTAAEDEKLTSLVNQTNGTDWIFIGQSLNRSSADCYSRCYSTLNPIIVPCDFSKQDDELLAHLVLQIHGESSWPLVALDMGTGHTEVQLGNRWNKTLKPGISSGRWNPVLDAKLKAAVDIYGEGKWTLIAQHVPGKTDRKCRERYMEKLAPGLKPSGEWEPTEDEILLSAVREHGIGSWSKIKNALPGRTDQMCRYRYKRLTGGSGADSSRPPTSEEEDALKYEEKLNRMRELKLARTRSSPSNAAVAAIADTTPKRGRGRPRKTPEP